MSSTNGKVIVTPDGAARGSSTAPPQEAAVVPPREVSFSRTLWNAWKAYTHRAGAYQSQVLLSAVYFFILGPSILIAKVTGSKLLDLDMKPRPSYWIERAPAEKTVAAMVRQF